MTKQIWYIYFKYVRNPCLSRENPWGTTPSPCWSASITTKAATFSSKRSSSAPSSRPSIFRMSCELRCSTFDLKNIKGDFLVPAELTKGENSNTHSSSLLCSAVSLLISSKKSHTSEILRVKNHPGRPPQSDSLSLLGLAPSPPKNPVPQWQRKGWTPGPSATSDMPTLMGSPSTCTQLCQSHPGPVGSETPQVQGGRERFYCLICTCFSQHKCQK